MITELNNNETDYQLLVDYLQCVDKDFGVPLSYKVNIQEFARKVLAYGHVVVIKEKEGIVALGMAYCNDTETAKGHLPILSVKQECRGKGFSRMLVNAIIDISRQHGMQKICVDSVNPVAISLYLNAGFKVVREEEYNGLQKKYMEYVIMN